VSSTTDQPEPSPADDFVSTEELVRRQGVKPITSVDELAAAEDPFESDEEYEEFLADLYASRHADIA
jgi:heme oxygenase